MEPILGVLEDYRFITTEFYIQESLNFISKLIADGLKFDAIVGVARSGLIGASAIACHFHLPLFTLDHRIGKILPTGNGSRLEKHFFPKKFLIFDDSYMSGLTARKIFSVKEKYDAYYIVLFSSTFQPQYVDAFGYFYPPPHFFQWCFMNTAYSKYLVVDFDGILCPDMKGPPFSEEEFEKYVLEAPPLYLPIRFPVIILSARPSNTIENSLKWLEKHKVKFLEFHYWEDEPDLRWVTPNTIHEWKANKLLDIMTRNHVNFFVESREDTARYVAYKTGVPCICPSANCVFGWSSDKLDSLVYH